MRPIRPTLIACALLASICLAWDKAPASRDSGSSVATGNPFAGQADAIMAGRKLYLKNCSHCHGQDGFGKKRAVNLHSTAIQLASPAILFRYVRNGNLRAGMPSWSHLPDQQIWQLVSYIQSMGDKPAELLEATQPQH